MRAKLKPEIVKYLKEKTELAESTIRSSISRLRADYPSCTPNAVAQIFARERGYTVMQKLSSEDKKTLPNMELIPRKIPIQKKSTRRIEKIVEVIKYETEDYFIKGHIEEINRAYTKHCYTSVHVLARKIIENLVREILSKKFSPTKLENKELYFDINQKRFKDFSVILKNLYNKRHKFNPDEIKIIERLYQKAKKFKDDSNDATHSWYHLVESKNEIDALNIQSIIELIKKINS